MSKIPKIAVCMSGMIRNYHHTFDRFKKYIIEPLNPDIFVYTHGRTDKDEDFLVSNYKPIKYLIHRGLPPEAISRINRSGQNYNLTSQFFNINECNKLKKQFEDEHSFKYDLVMRVRFDAFFNNYFSEEQLNIAISKILVPWGWSFTEISHFAKPDIFAMSSSSNMDTYSSLYDRLNDYNECKYHPESLVGYNLMVNNIPTEEYIINFQFHYPDELLSIIPDGYTRFNYVRAF